MAQTFNGATIQFTDSNTPAVVYFFNVRDFSEAGNDRGAIDVTTATSARRRSVYGYAEPTEFTFECVYDINAGQVPGGAAITRGILEGLLLENTGGLEITFVNSDTSGAADTFGGSHVAVVKGFTFSGEVDGVIVYSITFGVLH